MTILVIYLLLQMFKTCKSMETWFQFLVKIILINSTVFYCEDKMVMKLLIFNENIFNINCYEKELIRRKDYINYLCRKIVYLQCKMRFYDETS